MPGLGTLALAHGIQLIALSRASRWLDAIVMLAWDAMKSAALAHIPGVPEMVAH